MALGNITTFTLDMVPGGAPPILHASAGDVGRKFTANLLYNGEPYDIQGNRVTIRGTKPDRTVFEYNVDDFDRDDSWVDFLLTEQMAIVSGKVLCELREYLNDDQIGSANFILDVEQEAFDPDAASETEISTFTALYNDATEALADATATLDSIPADYSALSAAVDAVPGDIAECLADAKDYTDASYAETTLLASKNYSTASVDTVMRAARLWWGTTLKVKLNPVGHFLVLVNQTAIYLGWFAGSPVTVNFNRVAGSGVTVSASLSNNVLTITASESCAMTVLYFNGEKQ